MKEPLSTPTLLVALAAGLTDLTVLARHQDALAGEAGMELALLTADGRRPVSPTLTEADIQIIVEVGHQVYAQDRDNLADWAALAETIARADRSEWRPRLRHSYQWYGAGETRAFIAALLDAGRSAHYGRSLVERAVAHNTSPDIYGFGPTLTPGVFSDLAQAGVGGAELDVLLANEVSLDDAVSLIADGCPAGGILAAKRQGIEREHWRDLLTGMNDSWFPLFDGSEDRPMNTIRQGALGRQGFTWKQLRELTDNGWNDVSSYNLLTIRYGTGRRSGGSIVLTPGDAVEIAKAGVTYTAMSRWATALTTASRDSYAPKQTSTPLAPYGARTVSTMLPMVVALRAAGVSPSGLADYRYAGCATVQDVLAAAAAGITGTRAKQLRESHGAQLVSWSDRRYLRDLDELLAAHARESAGRGSRQRVGTRQPAAAQ